MVDPEGFPLKPPFLGLSTSYAAVGILKTGGGGGGEGVQQNFPQKGGVQGFSREKKIKRGGKRDYPQCKQNVVGF